MAHKRTCFICGNDYDYCPTCDRDRLKPSWYALFCCDSCHELNSVLSANTSGRLSLAEAQMKLKQLNFNKNEIKNDLTLSHIEKIMNYKENFTERNFSKDIGKYNKK